MEEIEKRMRILEMAVALGATNSKDAICMAKELENYINFGAVTPKVVGAA